MRQHCTDGSVRFCRWRAHTEALSEDSRPEALSTQGQYFALQVFYAILKPVAGELSANCCRTITMGRVPQPCGQFHWPKNQVKCPHLTMLWRGQDHGLASFLLPTRLMRSRVALRHVARHWVQARPARSTRASSAQAQTLQRAYTVCGPDAQAPLCPV